MYVDAGTSMIEFRLLGPVGVWANGQRVDLGRAGGPKARAVLAVLAMSAGKIVDPETLSARVWGAEPRGPDVRYKYVAWLREALRPFAIALDTREGGYLLDVDPERVDLERFRRAVRQGRNHARQGDSQAAAHSFEAALAIWRGDALLGIPGSWADSVRTQLERERVDAMVHLGESWLSSRPTAEALAELAMWATEHPLDERVAALLISALTQAGRRGEALAEFDAVSARLRTALGVGPGEELRLLRQRISDGVILESAATAENSSTAAREIVEGAGAGVPRQLPPALRHFVGRRAELAALYEMLEQDPVPGSPMIVNITGTAGAGKSTLAVHWAHRISDRFPHGQIHVNLNGFGPHGDPLDPQEVIANILDALDVPRGRMPADREARLALYRSLIAKRRVLLLLDNARSSDQVRPLLPAGERCLVIITSRNRMASLVAGEGATPLPLRLLEPAEAYELLAQRVSERRIAAERPQLQSLIARCSGLPLALALVSARLAMSPEQSLSSAAAQLDEARTQLDLAIEDESSVNLRTIFSWSCRPLAAPAMAMFRAMGLHAGTDMSMGSIVSAAGGTAADARTSLIRLLDAGLVEESSPGRYRMHDLLKAYAVELATEQDNEVTRRATVRRILDFYLRAAFAAAMALDSQLDPITLPPPEPGTASQRIADRPSALTWFTTEHAVLLAVIAQSNREGFEEYTWRLAWTLAIYFQIRGHWADRVATQTTALEAARRVGDLEGQAHASRGLGIASIRVGRYDEALRILRSALSLFVELGDDVGRARTHIDLANALDRLDRPTEALAHDRAALSLFRASGHEAGEATALNCIGWDQARLGNHESTLEACAEALHLMRRLDDRSGQAATLDSIAYAHHHLGHVADAIVVYEEALALARDLGELPLEGEILFHLGSALLRVGREKEAAAALRHAVAVLDPLHDSLADAARELLSGIRASDRGAE